MARENKQVRRARGAGTIFWDPRRNAWIGRVPVGRSPAGHTLYQSVQRPTQAAVVAALKKLSPPGPTTTVREWCAVWIEQIEVRPSTRSDYKHTLDTFILPTLGHLQVAALTVPQLESAVRIWARRLTANTLRKNIGHLRTCLEAARRARLIPSNPARDVRKPRAKRVVTDPFTPAELASIIAHPGAGVLAFLAAVGCRMGEALAMDVGDYTDGTVSITKTYSRQHGTRSPKSDNGIRTIRVPSQVRPVVAAAIRDRTAGPLFPTPEGTRRQHNTVRAQWKVLLRNLGLEYRRPHVLRHSVATSLISAGVPLGDVAKYLGDSVQQVVKTYLHASGADPADAIEKALRTKPAK